MSSHYHRETASVHEDAQLLNDMTWSATKVAELCYTYTTLQAASSIDEVYLQLFEA